MNILRRSLSARCAGVNATDGDRTTVSAAASSFHADPFDGESSEAESRLAAALQLFDLWTDPDDVQLLAVRSMDGSGVTAVYAALGCR